MKVLTSHIVNQPQPTQTLPCISSILTMTFTSCAINGLDLKLHSRDFINDIFLTTNLKSGDTEVISIPSLQYSVASNSASANL